jgi:hypothetical protein
MKNCPLIHFLRKESSENGKSGVFASVWLSYLQKMDPAITNTSDEMALRDLAVMLHQEGCTRLIEKIYAFADNCKAAKIMANQLDGLVAPDD